MTSWQTVKTVLDEALDRPMAERERFLEESCGEDRELFEAVEALLALEDGSGEFLAEPIFTLHQGPAEDANLGRVVGSFRLARRLADGGMGAVYLGERRDGFEQHAAVKLIKRGMDSEEILRRFALERQILAHLSHDGIAKLLDGGTTAEGLPYFAMEYVEGVPLDLYCDRQRLEIEQRIDLFLEVCEAVAFAHRNLVIHRDLKPSNILVTEKGRPKLLDFGIAKLLTAEGASQGAATVLGTVPMTPGYASPEQLKGQALTTSTDIYSLGVILYQLLTHRRPYRLETMSLAAWIAALERQQPLRPSSVVMRPVETVRNGAGGEGAALLGERFMEPARLRGALRGDLDLIVLKAMAKEPAERYGSVGELVEDLTLYREGLPIRSRPQTWRYKATKFLKRHPLGVGVAAVFVLLLGGSTAVMALQRQQLREANALLSAQRDRSRAAEEYLTNVFEAAGTNRARDEPMTALELIEHGARELKRDSEMPEATRAVLLDVNGRVFGKLDLKKQAVDSLEEALEIRRNVLASDDPLLAETMNNLANTLRRASPADPRIETLFRDSVAIWRKHPPTEKVEWETFSTSLANLASFLGERGQPAEAPALYEEALAIKEKWFGKNSPEYAKTLNLLAGFHLNQGNYLSAEPMLRTVLEIRREQKGLSAQEELLTSLNNLGLLSLALGKKEAASTLLNEDWPKRREIYADNPGKLAIGWISRGLLAEAEGRILDARDAYIEAQALAGSGPVKSSASRNFAALLSRHPELGDCEPLALEVVDHYRRTHPGTWQVADAESVLGGCLMAKNRLDEAEPLIEGGYARLKELTKRRPNLPEARERLVELYRRTGREPPPS